MSRQPFSRADRNLARRGRAPRNFAGRPARFLHDEERITVCVAVDRRAGTATCETMTRAEHDRRWRPSLKVTTADVLASFANHADAYHFSPFADIDPATAFAGIDRNKPRGWKP